MHFDLLVPCSNCPFRKLGGVRVTVKRAKQIAGNMLSPAGGTFACHKTTAEVNGERVEVPTSRHCAGALMFAEKNKNATQMMRIAERLCLYDSRKLMAQKDIVDTVFDSVSEMLRAHRGSR